MVLTWRQHKGDNPTDGANDHTSFGTEAATRPAQSLTLVALF